MNKGVALLWLLSVSVLGILSGLETAAVFSQETVEAIVAIVNDDVITLSEFQKEHELLIQTLRAQVPGEDFEEQYKKLRGGMLESMITNKLLQQEAERLGIEVTDQINMTIENIKKEYNLTSDAQLRQIMQQQGVDFDQWKQEMEKQYMQQGVVMSEVGRHIVVDDSEVLNYYQQHPEEFTLVPEYTLKAIYLSQDSKTPDEIQNKKNEINTKLEGGDEFGALASEYSEGPEKDLQGDLGSFKQGELEASLEKAIEGLKAGETSAWLNSRNGWYLLKLIERKDSRLRSFDDCRKEIEDKLFSQRNNAKLAEYLKELKQRSYIKILIPDPLNFKKE